MVMVMCMHDTTHMRKVSQQEKKVCKQLANLYASNGARY
jgi:hypothetical protein